MRDEKHYFLNWRKKIRGGRPPPNINKLVKKMLKIRTKIWKKYVLHTVRKLNSQMFGFFWKVKLEGATTPKCISYHLCNKM